MKRQLALLVCGLWYFSPAAAQENILNDSNIGFYIESRWYFDSVGVKLSSEAYSRRDILKKGKDQLVGIFIFARANTSSEPNSALVTGMSYTPIPFIGMEMGGGINATDHEEWYYVRGRLWLGKDMRTLAAGDLFYFDNIVEIGGRGFHNWESRLKIRITPWFGFGFFAEKTKGIGPRVDIQPEPLPFVMTVSLSALVARWDAAEQTLKPRDIIGGIFVRIVI